MPTLEQTEAVRISVARVDREFKILKLVVLGRVWLPLSLPLPSDAPDAAMYFELRDDQDRPLYRGTSQDRTGLQAEGI